jgi:hypothetical protein
MKISDSIGFSSGFKRVVLIIVILNGMIGIKRIVESFSLPEIFRKDFIQEYLLAKAVLNGVNPYLPLPDLAGIWIGSANHIQLKHPSPHPPTIGLLGLPLGLLSYEKAAIIWLIFELACLMTVMVLVFQKYKVPIKAKNLTIVSVATIGWIPVVEDLWLGQLSICLLLLLTGAWFALRDGKTLLGGGLLGGVITLKLMAWPIVIFLALRCKWNGVIAAASVVIMANLLVMAVIGFDSVKDYYFRVGPQVASIYRVHDVNYSVWTLGERLFGGFGVNFHASPLWPSPILAWLLTFLLPAVILQSGLWLALRARNFDTAFGLLVGVSVLVSPIAWTHYLTLVSIPLLVMARQLLVIGSPRRVVVKVFSLFLLLSVAGGAYSYATTLLASHTFQDGGPVVSFMAGLITLVPAAALIWLLLILWRLDNVLYRQEILENRPDKLSERVYAEAV